MPGTFSTMYVAAFHVDDRDQAIPAFAPSLSASEDIAVKEASYLASQHAGVVVWRRDGNPLIGEDGQPVAVFSVGRVGTLQLGAEPTIALQQPSTDPLSAIK